MKTIRLLIKDHSDRMAMLEALQDNGYNAWIETHTEYLPETRTYVCFDVPENEIYG